MKIIGADAKRHPIFSDLIPCAFLLEGVMCVDSHYFLNARKINLHCTTRNIRISFFLRIGGR